MLFLDEVLVSGKDRKGKVIAENNLECRDHERIQFKQRLINFGFLFQKRLLDIRVIWAALMMEYRTFRTPLSQKVKEKMWHSCPKDKVKFQRVFSHLH